MRRQSLRGRPDLAKPGKPADPHRMYCLYLPQGVTLAELKEAQRTNSLSTLNRDRQTEDGRSRLTDRSCLRGRWAAEDREETRANLAQSMETEDHSPTWSREIDEFGNHRSRLGTMEAEYSSASGPYTLPYTSTNLANRTSSRVVEWKDENQNPIEDPSKHVLNTREKQVQFCDQESDEAYQTFEAKAQLIPRKDAKDHQTSEGKKTDGERVCLSEE
ncbi:unnamed protein product [Coregonus sp. 'balchen']|nr:unnamed protein product [Coregonus sp. 'balchen']